MSGKKRGRKPGKDIHPSLTREFIEEVCNLVRMGNYYSTAAEKCGVIHQNATLWRRKGGTPEFAGTIYQELYEAVSKAESDFECLTVARINQHGNLNPNQLQWLLKNRFPARWGDKTQIEHTDGPKTVDTSKFTDEELFQFAQLCEKGKRT